MCCALLAQGHQYAITAASESAGTAPESDSHKVVYSIINKKSQVPTSVYTSEKQSITPKNGKNND